MKLRLFIFIIFELLIIGCNSPVKIKNHAQEMGLKGNVKSIKENEFKAIFQNNTIIKAGPERNDGMWDNYIIFNEQGNQIEKYNYDADMNMTHQSIYHYDRDNRLHEVISSSASNEIYMREIFTYNSEGLLTSKEIKTTPEESYYQTYEYDDNGYNINTTLYIDFQSTHREISIDKIYDYDGNLVEENDVQKRLSYEYDDEGNILVITREDKTGRKGNSRTEFIYDRNNKLVEKYERNDLHNLEFKFTYEYDYKNNWVKRTRYEKNNVTHLTERKIEYYN